MRSSPMHNSSRADQTDSWLIRSVGLAFLITALVRICLFYYPSIDDVVPLYYHLVTGQVGTLLDANLKWGRITTIPVAWILEWLGFDHSMLSKLLFFPNELLLALIVGLMIRRARPDLTASVAVPLILCATLHPGFFELNSYASARVTIFLSFCSILSLVHFWSSSPARNGLLCLVTSFIVMTSYQGALGFFMVVVATLVAFEVARPDIPLKRIAATIGACATGFLFSMMLNFGVLEMLRSYGVDFIFRRLSTPEMAAKFKIHLSRLGLEIVGPLTTPLTQNARLFVTGSLIFLAIICLVSNRPAVRERGPRFWMAVVLIIGVIGFAGLQLTSLPFDYTWFPPRTYFWYFAGLVFVVACAVSVASNRLLSSIWFPVLCWLPVTVLLIASVGLATSYSQGRARDFAIAHQIVTKFSDQGFKWDRPIVIGAGQYLANTGAIGDMHSLLTPHWSGIYLLGLVAQKTVIAPSSAQWLSGEAECSRRRPEIAQFGVSIEPEYALICFE
ncbi:hypothetical protein SAMN05428967_4481 [Phyllobacterium sp. YR620]|uniref:hypothetical protein n=1 Tax=Phyllobacterium sp. YR620 TaxID=1881066 RepID=UPI000888C297|nr:hypothetical protein [Phyllobacterium sp. YR620]SDP92572.1 hypothetical protein SAMN05428967_4481 [Phyllobacterium sp. YR620]